MAESKNLIERIKGWWNRLRGVKALPEGNITYNYPEDRTNEWRYDVSKNIGKSLKESQIEQLISDIRSGNGNLETTELTPLEISTCYNIAYNSAITPENLSYIGSGELVSRMTQEAQQTAREYQSIEYDMFLPNAKDVVQKLYSEKRIEEQKNSYRINNPMRKERLGQLANVAYTLAKQGNTLSNDLVLKGIEAINGEKIDISSENRAVELVDVAAAIKLAYARATGQISDKEINQLGGQSKILDEMNVQAKMDAYDVQSKKPENYVSLNKTLETMQRENDGLDR